METALGCHQGFRSGTVDAHYHSGYDLFRHLHRHGVGCDRCRVWHYHRQIRLSFRFVEGPVGDLQKSALQTVVVSIMVVTAQLFGWIVTYYNIPNLLATSIQSIASSATVFLFLVLVMLLIAGMFMEALSVVIIVAPILHPVALAYGIDPIFFGFFTVFVMCIGIATPPFGPCLFVSCSLSQRPFVKVSKEILPFIAVEILVAIILIFLPQIVTLLPNLVK